MKTKGLCFAVLALLLLTDATARRAHGQAGADEALPPGAVLRIGSNLLRHPGAYAAAYSPDGTLLATGGADVRLWDPKTKRLLRTMPLNRLDDGAVGQMRFSPDGKTIYVSGPLYGPGHVSGFDVASGKRLFRFQPQRKDAPAPPPPPAPSPPPWNENTLSTFDVSPDGKILATGGCTFLPTGQSVGNIVLWNIHTKEKLLTLPGLTDVVPLVKEVESLAFSPDGKWLAARARSGKWLHVFDVRTGKEKYAFVCPAPHNCQAVFSPDGYLAAYRPRQTAEGEQVWWPGPAPDLKSAIVLWDLKTGTIHQEIDWEPQRSRWGGYHGLTFSPDGKWMAGDRGVEKDGICVWDRATGKIRFTDPRPISNHGSPDQKPVFSRDGDTLVTSDGSSLEMWDLKTGRSVLADNGHTGSIKGFDLSSDGAVIATAATDGTLRLWDAKTGKERRRLEGINGTGNVVFSPDGKSLVSPSSKFGDGRMILWDAATGKELRRFQLPIPERKYQQGYPKYAVFSSDGKTLVIASDHNLTYHFFDVATGAEKNRMSWWFEKSGMSVQQIQCCLSPDGKHFAGVYEKKGKGTEAFAVALWDLTKPEPQVLSEGESEPDPFWVRGTYAMTFSPDGKYFAWSDAEQVHIWDVRANRKLESFKGAGRRSTSPLADAPGGLAFSRDGRYLSAGKYLHPLDPKYPPLQLPIVPAFQAFSPDSMTLAVVDQTTVLVFDVGKLARVK